MIDLQFYKMFLIPYLNLQIWQLSHLFFHLSAKPFRLYRTKKRKNYLENLMRPALYC